MATDLSTMLNQLLSGAGNALNPAAVQEKLAPLLELISSNGGLQAVLDKLNAAGLSEQVNSWIGSGANLAANPEQIMAALGPDQIKAAAEKAGTSATDLAGQLAAVLPTLVDKVTPSGSVPNVSGLTDALKQVPGSEQLQGLLGGLLGGGSSGAAPTPGA